MTFHALTGQLPGGVTPHMKGVGMQRMLVGNFELNP